MELDEVDAKLNAQIAAEKSNEGCQHGAEMQKAHTKMDAESSNL